MDGAGQLAERAGTFVRLALDNILTEYPNSPAHLLGGPGELVPPRVHHPAFYGAYDWHSSVHMHWLLLRLLRRCAPYVEPDTAAAAANALDAHFAPEALAAEAAYLRERPAFERPYGRAWLLALAAECARHRSERARRWSAALAPVVRTVAASIADWLPRAGYPVRHGTHANSAFALGLVLDSARGAGVPQLLEPVAERLRAWFLGDRGAELRWEPSGADFLSPVLCEADAVRRVLPGDRFAAWLDAFLPELSAAGESARERAAEAAEDTGGASGGARLLAPPYVADPADPQTGHLLGLCLSRAAALRTVAAALPESDARRAVLSADAEAHLAAGLPAVTAGDFTTGHWLATFAVLALEAKADAEPQSGPGPAPGT